MIDLNFSLKKAELEILKAKTDLNEAELLYASDFYAGASNRLYYSMFHGVSAIFAKDGIKTKTHKGSHNVFIKEYTMNGTFPENAAKTYSQLQSVRESGDYDCFYTVKKEDVANQIPTVKDFLEQVTQYKGTIMSAIDTLICRITTPNAKQFSAEQVAALQSIKKLAVNDDIPTFLQN